MATNVYKDTMGGLTIELPAATGSSGDPYLNGSIRGLLLTDSDGTNASVLTEFTSIVDVVVEAKIANGNSAVAVGDDIFYDSAETIKLNKDSTNGVFYGVALETVTSGSSDTIKVGLGSSRGGVGGASGVVEYAASGAIAIPTRNTTIVLTKAGVGAMTLAAPTALTHDGVTLTIISSTAQAHTLTNASPGFNGGGAASDVGTFGGAIGDNIVLVAHNAVWLVVSKTNVTLA